MARKKATEEYGFTRYYEKGKKSLGAVEDYSETKYMGNVIQFCRLRPYDLVLNSRKWESRINDLFLKWIDSFGASMNVKTPDRLLR